MAARLSKFVKDAYDGVILLKTIHLWCNNQVALHWIQNKKILPAYVINRVEEIKALIPVNQIRYVSTKDNPADQLTRGIPTEKLKESSLWLPHRDKWPEDIKFGKIGNCSEKATILTINPQPKKLMKWERFARYASISMGTSL